MAPENHDWLGPSINIPPPAITADMMRAIDEANEEKWRRAETVEGAAVATSTGITELVQAARDTEKRESTMLRWTIAGVVLAGIAAVASIIAIVVTIATAK